MMADRETRTHGRPPVEARQEREIAGAHTIRPVAPADLDELLELMRAYCDFYEVSPPDQQLLALAQALLEDPENEGVQLIARDAEGAAAGFATLYWSWSTASACRIGVMNDLFVAEHSRQQGLAEALIRACRSRCARRGARLLQWQTAPDNVRAQSVYDRIGGVREQWIDYSLPTDEARRTDSSSAQ
jgi:ribosomal protein S18 acetylase RimI-like enzyme